MEEYIVAYRTESLLHPRNFLLQGFNVSPSDVTHCKNRLWESEAMVVLPRGILEYNASYQQPIPYVIIHQDNKLLSYERLRPGEERLQNRFSIGFGGHMTWDEHDNIDGAIRRELSEELLFNGEDVSGEMLDTRLEPLGILKDWSDPVGAVHFGLVYLFDAKGLDIRPNEEHMSLRWHLTEDVLLTLNLENWSRIILNKFREEGHCPWKTRPERKLISKKTLAGSLKKSRRPRVKKR
jgi:predicted NUDIX family phosphoesterase